MKLLEGSVWSAMEVLERVLALALLAVLVVDVAFAQPGEQCLPTEPQSIAQRRFSDLLFSRLHPESDRQPAHWED